MYKVPHIDIPAIFEKQAGHPLPPPPQTTMHLHIKKPDPQRGGRETIRSWPKSKPFQLRPMHSKTIAATALPDNEDVYF